MCIAKTQTYLVGGKNVISSVDTSDAKLPLTLEGINRSTHRFANKASSWSRSRDINGSGRDSKAELRSGQHVNNHDTEYDLL